MPIRIIQRPPGQRKISRYRHTQSCIRIAGCAPGREAEDQKYRRWTVAGIAFLAYLAGIIAVLA